MPVKTSVVNVAAVVLAAVSMFASIIDQTDWLSLVGPSRYILYMPIYTI